MLALASVVTAQAQSKAEDVFKKYRFSLFLGPTFNSMRPVAGTADGYVVTKEGGNVGFSFGLAADLNINERYTLFSGIGMEWRGGRISAILPATTVNSNPADYVRGADVKYKIQYLTIPIGLKMMAYQFDKIKLNAITSFDAGLRLSQKGDYTFTTNAWDTAANKYVTKEFEKAKLGGNATVVPLSLGWTIGIGADYEINDKNSVYAQLLYRNGFVDVTTPKTNDKGSRFSDGNVRSNTVAIRIGYYF